MDDLAGFRWCMAPSQVIFMLWSFQNRYSNSYKLFKIKISKKCQNVSFGKLELFHDEDIKTDFVSTLCKLSFKNDCPNTLTYFIKWAQCKNLAPNALRFTYQNLKSYKPHEKNKTKNLKMLDLLIKIQNTKSLMVFVYFFTCCLLDFKFWYVNRKAFGESFLYGVYFT